MLGYCALSESLSSLFISLSPPTVYSQSAPFLPSLNISSPPYPPLFFLSLLLTTLELLSHSGHDFGSRLPSFSPLPPNTSLSLRQCNLLPDPTSLFNSLPLFIFLLDPLFPCLLSLTVSCSLFSHSPFPIASSMFVPLPFHSSPSLCLVKITQAVRA